MTNIPEEESPQVPSDAEVANHADKDAVRKDVSGDTPLSEDAAAAMLARAKGAGVSADELQNMQRKLAARTKSAAEASKTGKRKDLEEQPQKEQAPKPPGGRRKM